MAFTRFSKDMNIISALANKPVAEGGLTASQFKGKFDEGGLALKEFVNALCGELENGNAAAWIGIQSITGLDATTIQGALIALKELASQVSSHASTHGTGGSDPITPANIGAAASTHTHTPESLGAAEANHSHTPESLGAAAENHTHGTSGINDGAITTEKLDANGIALKLSSTRYGTSVPETLPTGELFVVYRP